MFTTSSPSGPLGGVLVSSPEDWRRVDTMTGYTSVSGKGIQCVNIKTDEVMFQYPPSQTHLTQRNCHGVPC